MISLDHVGVVGHSIHEMRRTWLDAGFFVTEPEELMALEPATGKQVSLGQHSCHVILENGYIELTAVDRVTPMHHLFPWITGGVSLGIIAFGTQQIESVHQRLVTLNVPASPIAQASRPICYGARRGDALFTWFALGAPSTPEALVCFVRNERPELVYQPEVQAHRNAARALEGVILCTSDPIKIAERYSIYADVVVLPVANGLWRCPLDRGSIWIGAPTALAEHFGYVIPAIASGDVSEAPRSVGFVVARRDSTDGQGKRMFFWFHG